MDNNNQEKKEISQPEYTPEELLERGRLITMMSVARDEREETHPEFDGMTYSQYYDSNKRADMSYIPPKKNKADKRIVTGYTREKDNTLLSALLSYNFEPNITVYDDTEMVFPELGNHMEDMVKKSREVEQWGKMRPLVYRELIAQGAVFTEEIWECVYTPDVTNTNSWKPGMPIKDAKFDTKLKPKKMERAAVKLHQGKNVYLGDFYLDDYKKQDLVFTYEVMSRVQAESIYGTWDRWENVPMTIDNTIVQDANGGETYYNWNLTRTQKDQVGILKIQRPFENKYQIMINGVMMLPVNFPLSEVSPDGGVTINMQVLEGINGCAYGKGQPAKTKVDQAVHDEFLRLMILREEQAGAPPMGYKGKRVLSRDIYNPGKISNNMKEGDLFPILPQSTGLNTADFSMYQLIKTMIDDKTINATFSGDDAGGQKTATQIVQEKQQQLLKLGLNFDAIKELEKSLTWARIGNLIKNYPRPTDKKANVEQKTIDELYRQMSIETTLPDGKAGVKIFEFTDKEFPDKRVQQTEEQVLSEYYQKPVQKVYFNGPEFMKLLKFRWVVNIVPTQENSSDLERELFVMDLREAKELFPGQVNDEYAKERFAIKIKEDPTRFFLQNNGMLNPMQQALQNPAVVGQQGMNPAQGGGAGAVVSQPQIKPVK